MFLLALHTNVNLMLVLLDLIAAFDTIDHSILLHWGTALRRLQSYLTDRTQFVLYEGSESKHCKLRFGVPQGSSLVHSFLQSTCFPWATLSAALELASTAMWMTPNNLFL